MIFLYIILAIFLQVLYVNISVRVFDFWTNFFVLKRGGITVPINGLIWYLTVAMFLFTMFHILVITFVFVVLE